MREGVTLRAAVRADLIAHARADAPNECCGLLIGRGGVIDGCVRARNLHPAPATRYILDPAIHIATRRQLRGTGREVIGCYHSHPAAAAVPSETDVAEAHYPEFVWLIVSLSDVRAPDIAAYRFDNGRFSPLAVVPAA